MTGPGKVGLTFLAAVIAAVIGWFAGGAVRDATAPAYDTAISVVDAAAGMPVQTSSPTPSPSIEATDPPSPTDASPSPTPEATQASILCAGEPPDENCDCDLRDGEWVWVCELPATSEPDDGPGNGNGNPNGQPFD